MLYMFLIMYDPSIPPEPGRPNLQPKHAAYEAELREEGVYHGGGALMPPRIRPAIRVREGEVSKIDGPFAETKELLGGFFVIDCKDDADATERAKKIAVGDNSWIDVMQVPLWHPR
jgi:hypothetical protein